MPQINSRKLLAFLFAFIVSVLLLYFSKLTGAEWTDFAKWSLLAYVGGNVGEHFSQRPGKDGESS